MSFQIHKIKNKNLTLEHFQEYHNGNFFDLFDKAKNEGTFLPADDWHGEYSRRLAEFTVLDILHDAVLHLATNFTLVIVSGTDSSIIREFIKKENLAECFSDVFGADIDRSKVIKIKSILNKYNVAPEDTVFITDTLGDIKESNECSVPTIGVTWGLHTQEILGQGNPVAIVDDPSDLVTAIENVLK